MSFKVALRNFFTQPRNALIVYSVIAVVVSVLQYLAGDKAFNGIAYTHYNNYVIFKQSVYHLFENKNLYEAWPQEHWDYYKYSPSFPILFSPFILFPDFLGLSIWNLLNALVLFFAIKNLNGFSQVTKTTIQWFVLPELVVSLQNSQSNGLIAGLIISAFNLTENRRFLLASVLIAISAFIKVFGVIAFVFFLFQKERIKAIAIGMLVMVIFSALPLVICSLYALRWQYDN